MTTLRVLNVLNEREIGGAQLHVLQVASRLKSENIESFVAIPGGSGGIAILLKEHGVPFYEVPQLRRIRQTFNPWTHLRWAASYLPCVFQLMRIIRKEGIHIVHQHGILHTQGAVAGRLAGIKVVWHLHGMVSPLLSKLFRPLVPVLAHIIVANSQETARAYFHRSMPRVPGGVKIIYPPVNTASFQKDQDYSFRDEWGIPPSALLVGMVGNINPLKGHLDFIRAANIISQSIPDCHFMVAGRSLPTRQTYYHQLLKEVQRLDLKGKLHFAGFRADIPAVLASFNILVNPSHSEGFGMVVAEAMAAAKPIVASAVGGAREMLPDASYGLVVEPRSPQAIADSVLYLANNPGPARDMASRAATRAAEKFGLELCARKHRETYEEVSKLGKDS